MVHVHFVLIPVVIISCECVLTSGKEKKELDLPSKTIPLLQYERTRSPLVSSILNQQHRLSKKYWLDRLPRNVLAVNTFFREDVRKTTPTPDKLASTPYKASTPFTPYIIKLSNKSISQIFNQTSDYFIIQDLSDKVEEKEVISVSDHDNITSLLNTTSVSNNKIDQKRVLKIQPLFYRDDEEFSKKSKSPLLIYEKRVQHSPENVQLSNSNHVNETIVKYNIVKNQKFWSNKTLLKSNKNNKVNKLALIKRQEKVTNINFPQLNVITKNVSKSSSFKPKENTTVNLSSDVTKTQATDEVKLHSYIELNDNNEIHRKSENKALNDSQKHPLKIFQSQIPVLQYGFKPIIFVQQNSQPKQDRQILKNVTQAAVIPEENHVKNAIQVERKKRPSNKISRTKSQKRKPPTLPFFSIFNHFLKKL